MAPADRLDSLVAAAMRVFAERGYQRAQMADIAREMGVSPGTLYLYVESKEALFHLVLLRAMDEARGVEPTEPPVLPVPTPSPAEMLSGLKSFTMRPELLPVLSAALAAETVPDPRAELEAVVCELYDSIDRHHAVLEVLERSALDWPELASVYTQDLRCRVVDRLSRYLSRRARAGLLRPVPDDLAMACLMLESIAWFAWHRLYEPQVVPLDDATARATVVHTLIAALAPPEGAGA